MEVWKDPIGSGKTRNLIFILTLLFFEVGCSSSQKLSDQVVYQAAKNKKNIRVSVHEPVEDKKISEVDRRRLSNAEYHFGMAQAYSAGGHTDQAIEEYKLVLIYDPDSPMVYLRLAAEFVKKGALSDGLVTSKKAVELDPKFIDARLMLAGLYSSAQQNEEAISQYTQILNLDPYNDEAAVYRSQIYLEEGKMTEAISELKKFIMANSKNKRSAAAWYYLGRMEQQTGNLKSAESSYRRALGIQKGFFQAALALGSLYEVQNRNQTALKVYQTFYEVHPHQAIASRMATILLKEEKYADAIPYLEMIRAGDPNDLNVRVKLGLVRMELKQYDQAIKIFNEILKSSPHSERVLYYLGSLYEEMGQHQKAINYLKKIHHESKFFEDSALHVTFLLKKLKRKKEAKAMLTAAIKKAPNFPAFYIFNASLEEDDNRIHQAIGGIRKSKRSFSR